MKTGDRVRFLNSVGGGIVKGFKNKDIVWVEENDGFETPAFIRECIVVEPDKSPVKTPEKKESQPEPPKQPEKPYEIVELPGKDRLNVYLAFLPVDIKMIGKCPRELLISASDLQEAMTQKAKADNSYRPPAPVKKEKTQPVIEVDLHINQLLDSTSGLSNTDMLNVQLEKFRQTMEEYKNKKGQKIVFIHGKGEGVLRNVVLSELKSKYKNCPVQDASFKEYGFGATMVTIR